MGGRKKGRKREGRWKEEGARGGVDVRREGVFPNVYLIYIDPLRIQDAR